MKLVAERLDFTDSLARLDRVLHGVDLERGGDGTFAIAGLPNGGVTTHVQFDDGIWREIVDARDPGSPPFQQCMDLRQIGPEFVLAIAPRVSKDRPHNAFALDRDGKLTHSFTLGDAVLSAIQIGKGDMLVATYDEAQPQHGVARRSLSGRVSWSLDQTLRTQSMRPTSGCGSLSDDGRLAYLGVDWGDNARLFTLDPATMHLELLAARLPDEIDVFQAIVPVADGAFLVLCGEYAERRVSFWYWKPSAAAPERLGSAPRPFRWPRTMPAGTIVLVYETHADAFTCAQS